VFASEIRKRRIEGMRSSRWRWHLDEVFVKINGEQNHLSRAVDHEGEVLENFVTKTRDKKAALKFLRKLMKRHGRPHVFVTDKLTDAFAAFVRITVITSGRANARILPKAVIDTKWSEQQKGDLIAGSTNSFIAKLVERRMRYVMLVKVSGKETQTFVAALVSQVQYLLREPRRALTWDCGKELADHESLNAGHRSRHLLLRAPQSLATPHQRKHKQAPAPVLPERYRLLHRQ
jgi:hypothetical protein